MAPSEPALRSPGARDGPSGDAAPRETAAREEALPREEGAAEVAAEGITMPGPAAPRGTVLPPCPTMARLGRADAMGKTGVTPAGVGAAYGCMVMVVPWIG